VEGGAVRSVAWSCDGARLAVGGAAGMLAVGHTVQRRAEWRQYSVVLQAPTRIRVQVSHAEAGSAQSGQQTNIGARDTADPRSAGLALSRHALRKRLASWLGRVLGYVICLERARMCEADGGG
jgi:hypothetical protein